MVAISAYLGGTRGSAVLASVGGVCDMCMCLARE